VVCDLPITDSGVATTIYIADSYTATSATKKSQALTLTVAGTGAIGTISLGGTSFNSELRQHLQSLQKMEMDVMLLMVPRLHLVDFVGNHYPQPLALLPDQMMMVER